MTVLNLIWDCYFTPPVHSTANRFLALAWIVCPARRRKKTLENAGTGQWTRRCAGTQYTKAGSRCIRLSVEHVVECVCECVGERACWGRQTATPVWHGAAGDGARACSAAAAARAAPGRTPAAGTYRCLTCYLQQTPCASWSPIKCHILPAKFCTYDLVMHLVMKA